MRHPLALKESAGLCKAEHLLLQVGDLREWTAKEQSHQARRDLEGCMWREAQAIWHTVHLCWQHTQPIVTPMLEFSLSPEKNEQWFSSLYLLSMLHPHCTDTASNGELQSTLFLGFLKTTSFMQDMIKEKQRMMFLTVWTFEQCCCCLFWCAALQMLGGLLSGAEPKACALQSWACSRTTWGSFGSLSTTHFYTQIPWHNRLILNHTSFLPSEINLTRFSLTNA